MALHLKSTGLDFVDFGQTGEPNTSLTSELLDDYEEGTWRVAWSSSLGTAGTYTATNDPAYYTNIGRQVYIQCSTYITNMGSYQSTGQFRGSGMPFDVVGIGELAVSAYPSTNVDAVMRAGSFIGGTTAFYFKSGSLLDSVAAWGEIQTGAYCRVSGWYRNA